MKFIALAACTLVMLAACTRSTPSAQVSSRPTAQASETAQPSASPDSTPTSDPAHVFVIVLENRSADQVSGSGYIAQLAQQYGVATNYHGVYHPSLPNYLAMTSGSTWGVADDGWHPLPPGGLGTQLTNAGLDWRAYMEGMAPGGCYRNGNGYALKHDPFAYYGARCPSQVVPFTSFASDMAGTVPRFVWITPDLCHDGHDCGNSTVNAWLQQTVPVILNSDAWQSNGVLFITWDEGEDSANSVLTLVIHPNPLNHRSGAPYNHYSLLATIEDLLGVPRLGAAAQATPMNDLMAAKPPPVLRNRT
jgi:phospholipase C